MWCLWSARVRADRPTSSSNNYSNTSFSCFLSMSVLSVQRNGGWLDDVARLGDLVYERFIITLSNCGQGLRRHLRNSVSILESSELLLSKCIGLTADTSTDCHHGGLSPRRCIRLVRSTPHNGASLITANLVTSSYFSSTARASCRLNTFHRKEVALSHGKRPAQTSIF